MEDFEIINLDKEYLEDVDDRITNEFVLISNNNKLEFHPDTIVLFSSNKFYNNLIQNSSSNSIEKQLTVDLPRQECIINNYKYINSLNTISEFQKYLTKKELPKAIMCSTQAVLAEPVTHLFNYFRKKNTHIIDSSSRLKTIWNLSDNNKECVISKTLNMVDIDYSTISTKGYLKLDLQCPFNNPSDLIYCHLQTSNI